MAMGLSCCCNPFIFHPTRGDAVLKFHRLSQPHKLPHIRLKSFQKSPSITSRIFCCYLKAKLSDDFDEGEEEEAFDDIDDEGDELFDEDEDAEFFEEDDDDDYKEFEDTSVVLLDEVEKELLVMKEKPTEPQPGDGEEGGGVSFGDTTWGTRALAVAEEAIQFMNEQFEVFAFKATTNGSVQVRIDKLTDEFGSPTSDEIEAYTTLFLERLKEAVRTGSVPENVAVAVSSPGAERVLRIPRDLDRFRHLPMYVKYLDSSSSQSERTTQDGVFSLDVVEVEEGYCIWKLADVKFNRQKLGKGRTFNKKQREWRLNTNFESLELVRLHLDV